MIKPIKKIHGVLFDLDGTLADTAPDLALSLNDVLTSRKIPTIDASLLRPYAGRGSRGLLNYSLNIDENHPDFPALSEAFFNYYEQNLLKSTRLFQGMETVLQTLDAAQIPWGIVTNKPQRFTERLLKNLNLFSRTQCILSGDSLQNRKPHPEPIFHACELLAIKPSECIFIGDAEIDIIAAKAAGSFGLVAMYGYIPTMEDPKSWGADGLIYRPEEILDWI